MAFKFSLRSVLPLVITWFICVSFAFIGLSIFSTGRVKRQWGSALVSSNFCLVVVGAIYIWACKIEWRWLKDILNFRVCVTFLLLVTDSVMNLAGGDRTAVIL